jgi:phosphohistidine phosphatase
MKRELLILRHGHAKDDTGRGDFHRDLKDKGKRNAQRIGVWLAQNDALPDLVISSPAIRAKQTAEKSVKSSGLNVSVIQLEDTLYDASAKAVMKVIHACPSEVQRLMIVGHNPSLFSIISKLSREDISMTPATLVRFSLDCEWDALSRHYCQLDDVVVASDLPELFPFPEPDSAEQRPRPAYYYHQSSVVPYRIQDGELQVLIISSSSHKHWGVPKGIQEPGLTAQDSALREAFEEAGVQGRVIEQTMGSYRYQKWDAQCDVSVYAMQVTQVLDDVEWQENTRNRQWVTPAKAAEFIDTADLAAIVSTLPDFLAKQMS